MIVNPKIVAGQVKLQHQEAPERVTAVLSKLRQPKLFPAYELEISDDFVPATEMAVGRAHSRQYQPRHTSMAAAILN